jgi:hypothetical protein
MSVEKEHTDDTDLTDNHRLKWNGVNANHKHCFDNKSLQTLSLK